MPNNDFLLFTHKHDVDEATFHDILVLWSEHGEAHTFVGINGATDVTPWDRDTTVNPRTTIGTTSEGAGIRFRDGNLQFAR